MMSKRMFSTSVLAGAAVALLPAAARSQNAVKACNAVMVRGAYADVSSWSGHAASMARPKQSVNPPSASVHEMP
jgi:hypothetical protein